MKKYQYILINSVMIIFAFLGGTYYGFNEGVDNFHHLEKVLSTNTDVLRAKDLQKGGEKNLKGIYWHFEMSINEGLDSYNWYQKSGSHLFSKVFLSEHLKYLDISIKNIATYRSENQVEGETDLLLCQLPESKEEKKYCLKRLVEREETVRIYGNES